MADRITPQAALAAIKRQRDYHAEHGTYEPGHFRPSDDQQFDDWAADLAEAGLRSLDDSAPRYGEGPSGQVCDALALMPWVAIAECFDGAQSGYFTRTDGREFRFAVEEVEGTEARRRAELDASIAAARGYVADPRVWNPPTPKQIELLLQMVTTPKLVPIDDD